MMTRFVGLIFVGYVTVACVTNSEGRKTIMPMPDGQMNTMGGQAFNEILAEAKSKKILVDSSHQYHEIVERIGRRIAAASQVDFAWEFAVIDDKKMVNAFCLPGGKIAVYTGIFPVAKDEASLAAVMGHEVAHATMKHGAERMSQQLAIAGLATGAQISMKDSRYRDIAMGVFGLGAQFGLILPFSRAHETEADTVGLRYAASAGYDPMAAVGLWERMGAAGKSPPEFMSTHPDPANRRRKLLDQQSNVKPLFDASEVQPHRALPSL